MSAITSAFPESRLLPRQEIVLPLAAFGLAAAATYLHLVSNQSAAVGLLAASLLLALPIAPIEYGMGAISAAFLAATSLGTSRPFEFWRWVVLGLGAVVLLFRFFLRRRTGGGKPTQFSYLMLVFLAVSTFTLTTTAAVELAGLKLAAVVCMFFVGWSSSAYLADSYGPSSVRRLISGLLSYALVFVVLALPGFAGSGPPFFGNANTWGALLAIVIPWLPCQLSRRFSGHAAAKRLGLILGLAVAGYLLLRSGSRAAILGVVLAVTCICFIHANRRVAAVVALGAILFSTAVLSDPDLPNKLSQRYIYKYQVRSDSIIQSRAQPWRLAAQSVRENPWLGLGFGVTSGLESRWSSDVSSSFAKEMGSSLWATLVSVGILGAAPLFLAIFMLFVRGARFAWEVKDPWFTGVYGSLLALAVNSVFEGWLLAPGSFISLLFWIQCFLLDALMSRFRPVPGAIRFHKAFQGPQHLSEGTY